MQVLPTDKHAQAKLHAVFALMRRDLGTYEDDECNGNERGETSKCPAQAAAKQDTESDAVTASHIKTKEIILRENEKVFLFIRDRTILGCCVAQAITCARRLSSWAAKSDGELNAGNGSAKADENGNTDASEKCKLGISRIWVSRDARRKGVASRLVDAARDNFYYGAFVSKDECAMSDPTCDGRAFGTRYFERSDFLVYDESAV